MKLQHLNFTAIKKAVRAVDRRLSTNFLVALDEHVGELIKGAAVASGDECTLNQSHVAAAAKAVATVK